MMTEKDVVINGVTYVPKSVPGATKIVVLDRGFVYIGQVFEESDRIQVSNARNIIKWGTSKHLAQLADGPLEDTSLGEVCSFYAYKHSVIHIMDVNCERWESSL